MASTLKAAVDAMCIVPGDALHHALPGDRNPLMHAVDGTLHRLHMGDAHGHAAVGGAAGAHTRWMALQPREEGTLAAAWARAGSRTPPPPRPTPTTVQPAYQAMYPAPPLEYYPPLMQQVHPLPVAAVTHPYVRAAPPVGASPPALRGATGSARMRVAAGEIVRSMDAMDDRFRQSQLMAFMRDVQEGALDPAPGGEDGYPHGLGVDTPTGVEIARRVQALEELWRDALGGGQAAVPVGGASAAHADVHDMWGAAAEGDTPSFESYWGAATRDIAARVEATPAAREAEEARLKSLIDRAWDVAMGGEGEREVAAEWEDDTAAALFAEEGLRATRVLEAMAAGRAAEPSAAVEGGVVTRRYDLAPAEDNAVVAREMHAAAAGAEEGVDARQTRLFEEGVAAYREGRVRHAIQVFEAVLHGEGEHSEAWRMLGVCHAEMDDDRAAIACLERSVDSDPYNLNALLALCVSCVNERDRERALTTLRAWVRHHPRLQGVEALRDAYSDGSLTDEVLSLMHAASNALPDDGDVATVLGVLYNAAEEYGAAEEAFRDALRGAGEVAPAPGVRDAHSLWNRLGATQSLAGRHGEALQSYARALALKSVFPRGWLNAGIAYFNLGQYAPAAACYLHTLRLAPSAGHVWALLRVVFNRMGRHDLLARTEACNVEAFGDEFPLPHMHDDAAA